MPAATASTRTELSGPLTRKARAVNASRPTRRLCTSTPPSMQDSPTWQSRSSCLCSRFPSTSSAAPWSVVRLLAAFARLSSLSPWRPRGTIGLLSLRLRCVEPEEARQGGQAAVHGQDSRSNGGHHRADVHENGRALHPGLCPSRQL